MCARRKYSYNNPRLPAFTSRFKALVDAAGGVTKTSEITGISRPTINFWYNGERTPDAENLITISESFHVSVDYLLGLSDPDNSTKDEKLASVCGYTGLSNEAISRILLETTPLPGSFVPEGEARMISTLNSLLTSTEFWRIVRLLGSYVNIPKQEMTRSAEMVREYHLVNYGDDTYSVAATRDVIGYKMQRAFNALLDEIDSKERGGKENGKH